MSGDLKSYEKFLKRAYSEGWRDPIQVTNLEILAYEAGMITERNRVLSLFKDLEGEPVMRVMDMVRRLDSVRNP